MRACGIENEIDLYHPEPNKEILQWDQWTGNNIQRCCDNNGHVLLLCGKKITELLQHESNIKIEMYHGFIWKLTLQNLILHTETNPYFVPIFFNSKNEDFIPHALRGRRYFTVNASTLLEKANNLTLELELEENKSLRSLIAKLTNQQENYKPPLGASSSSKYKAICMYIVTCSHNCILD